MSPQLAPVRADETRTTETPNAEMTTLASPTLGTTEALSLWRVAMREGQRGPLHVFDAEQVWTVIEGRFRVEARDGAVELEAGDTLVLPAHVERQITAAEDSVALVAGDGAASVLVPGEEAPRGTPPWIA